MFNETLAQQQSVKQNGIYIKSKVFTKNEWMNECLTTH